MTALTADKLLIRNTSMEGLKKNDIPVLAATLIYSGAAIGVNSAGYGRGFVLGDKFAGHTPSGMDNSSGASGDRRVETLAGRYQLLETLSGASITSPFKRIPVYLQDDGTLSLRAGLKVGHIVGWDAHTSKALIEFDTEMKIETYAETLAFGDFTDNTDATGYVDLAVALPEGAIVHGWQADVKTGFTGDTTAVIQVGVAGNLDRFSAVTTNSVLAVDVVGSQAPAVSGDPGYLVAATTVRVTVTGGADFTSISAGELDLKINYSRELIV